MFKENNERVEGIVIKYAYASVIHVATENRKSVLVEQNRKEMSMNSEEEGYKVYDANGNLKRKNEDITIAPEAYADKFKELEGCEVYSIEQENGNYVISIDTEDHTFLLRVSGSGDTQEWDRFLNK